MNGLIPWHFNSVRLLTCPSSLNKIAIRGVLKKAKRWHMFADEVRPLPLRQKVGRARSYVEKLRLLKVSASRPEWQTASWAAVIALNSTMRGCEIKGLRWRDVDLLEKLLTVRKFSAIEIRGWPPLISLSQKAPYRVAET